MYQDVSSETDAERLLVMSAWNKHISNGSHIIRVLAEIKAIRAINPTAYDYYLDWVFNKSISGDGANLLDTPSLAKPMLSFAIADLKGISPSEASKETFNEDVFEGTDYGGLTRT